MKVRFSLNKHGIPLLTAAALLSIYLAGVHIRAHRLDLALVNPLAPFWLESAQHYRGIRFVARGEPLPDPDYQIQWPEGFDPDRDTVVQEYVIGLLARALHPPRLETFVRRATPWVFGVILLPLYWVSFELTRRRWAALFAVAIYATCPAAVDRSFGLVVYRENVALPIFALQVAALYAHFRRARGQAFAWLSGGALLLAHFTWKVTTFYQLFVLGALTVLVLLRPPDRKVETAVLALGVPPLLVSILLPVALHIDRYWGSPQAALTGGLLAVTITARYRPCWVRRATTRAAVLAGVTGVLLLVLPGMQSYPHAWDTLVAKIRYLGVKPADPSLLSIHARHYWTGNYRSPTPARILREFALPVLLCVMLFRRLSRNVLEETARGERFGGLFLVLGLAGFAVGYLMFRKFGTILAIFLTPFVALGACTLLERARHRRRLAVGVLAAALVTSTAAAWTGVGADTGLGMRASDDDAGVVYDVASMDALSRWILAATSPRDVFLASWALSPYLFTYLDRTTNLHSFFECDVVYRFEAFNLKLFGPLEELHAFARGLQATYLVYEANFLLRTDPWMSYRYVADHLDITGDEAAFRLHYTPEDTPGFRLVYQNDFFRVYRVLDDPAAREPPAAVPYAALFDPRVPGAQPGQPREAGPTLLYGTLEALRWVEVGEALEASGDLTGALHAYKTALDKGPYTPSAVLHLMALARKTGRNDVATALAGLYRRRFGHAPPPAGRISVPSGR